MSVSVQQLWTVATYHPDFHPDDSFSSFVHCTLILQLQQTPPNNAPKQAEIASAVERIKLWKPTLRKIKQKKQSISMAEQKDTKYDLAQLTSITSHAQMWRDFDRIIRKARENRITKEEHKLCTSALSALLLFNSAQRPGAVMGVKLVEFEQTEVSTGVS